MGHTSSKFKTQENRYETRKKKGKRIDREREFEESYYSDGYCDTPSVYLPRQLPPTPVVEDVNDEIEHETIPKEFMQADDTRTTFPKFFHGYNPIYDPNKVSRTYEMTPRSPAAAVLDDDDNDDDNDDGDNDDGSCSNIISNTEENSVYRNEGEQNFQNENFYTEECSKPSGVGKNSQNYKGGPSSNAVVLDIYESPVILQQLDRELNVRSHHFDSPDRIKWKKNDGSSIGLKEETIPTTEVPVTMESAAQQQYYPISEYPYPYRHGLITEAKGTKKAMTATVFPGNARKPIGSGDVYSHRPIGLYAAQASNYFHIPNIPELNPFPQINDIEKQMKVYALLKSEFSDEICILQLLVVLGIDESQINLLLAEQKSQGFRMAHETKFPVRRGESDSRIIIKVGEIQWIPDGTVTNTGMDEEVVRMDRLWNGVPVASLFWQRAQIVKDTTVHFAATCQVQQDRFHKIRFKLLKNLREVHFVKICQFHQLLSLCANTCPIANQCDLPAENIPERGITRMLGNADNSYGRKGSVIDLHSDGSCPSAHSSFQDAKHSIKVESSCT